MKKIFPLQNNKIFLLVLIIYSVLGIFLIRYYLYAIDHGQILHFCIAEKYLRGDFGNAINGYFGPLHAWLLVPFLHFALSPILAEKVLSLIIGLLTIITTRKLSYRFAITEEVRSVILYSLIPIILSFSLLVSLSDLLVLCFLAYYLSIIFDVDYSNARYKGILCGIAGAGAYLSRSYAFPFFIVHFALFNAFYYLRNIIKEEKQKVLWNFILGLSVFFILVGPWVYLISNKYKEITFGTAGRYNYRLIGSDLLKEEDILYYQGLLKPPNETAISSWEDPSYASIKSWNPVEAWEHFKYQVKLILKNIRATFNIYQRFSILSAIIIFAYILFCAMPFNKLVQEPNILYPLVTIVLYPAGYTLIFVLDRYLWISCILLILMGGYVLTRLFKDSFFTNIRKKILLIFFSFSFAVMPLIDLSYNVNNGRDIHNLSKTLASYDIQGKVVSNDYWPRTLYLAYLLHVKYYGMPKKDMGKEELIRDLKNHDIDYYFIWTDSHRNVFLFLNHYKEKTGDRIPELLIYDLKQKLTTGNE